ncbi:MAG TPA: HYR domain-containing protein, partial [Candidatus Thermoplasmatota archaeon]|nr:HYR domain-containing protein [Candidatus Thermoplasmatota archaeon]
VATCSPVSGGAFPLGVTTVTCSATDAAGNPATPVTFTVTVRDTTAPVLDAARGVSEEASGPSGSLVTYTAPSWEDLVDGSGVASCTPASGTLFGLGSTTVTCTATDAAGNTASTTFVVEVVDTTAPATSLSTSGALALSLYYVTTPTVTLACEDLVVCTETYYTINDGPTQTYSAPFTLADGVHTIAYWSTDGVNTESPQTRTLRVDTQAPVLQLPSSVTSPTSTVTYTVTATDNVDPSPSVTCTPASGSTFASGTTWVECVATDEAGHSTSGTFAVTVQASCSSSTWTGLLQPVKTDGSSIFKLGSTIPLKFRCGDEGAAIVTVSMVKVTNGVAGTETVATSTSGADSGNTFRWSSSDSQYIYNLATKPLSEGTWHVKVNFGNGDVTETRISLKK